MSEPDILADIRDCSARIDALFGEESCEFQPPPPGHVRVIDGMSWKGRKSVEPFSYDTAVTVMLIQRERAVLQADLPPLALVQPLGTA